MASGWSISSTIDRLFFYREAAMMGTSRKAPAPKAAYLIAAVFIAIGAYMALNGDFRASALVICMALFIALTSMAAHDEKRQKILRFIASVLLLLIPIIVSLYTVNMITRLLLYGLTLAWGVFVALFAYRLIFKKDATPKMKKGNV